MTTPRDERKNFPTRWYNATLSEFEAKLGRQLTPNECLKAERRLMKLFLLGLSCPAAGNVMAREWELKARIRELHKALKAAQSQVPEQHERAEPVHKRRVWPHQYRRHAG